jgi:hypothetical protein
MYLNAPPLVACIHLIIDPRTALMTCIVSFRCKGKILHKLWISVERSDTFYDVPGMEFQALITNNNLLLLERRLARQIGVNYCVQLIGI